MKIVVDTNILISGMLWSGPSARIIELGGSGEITIGISRAMYAEFCRVLAYPKFEERHRLKDMTVKNSAMNARRCVTFAERVSKIPSVCITAGDNEVLACAKDFEAECLITGDKEILAVGNQYLKAPILRAAEFLKKYFPEGKQ